MTQGTFSGQNGGWVAFAVRWQLRVLRVTSVVRVNGRLFLRLPEGPQDVPRGKCVFLLVGYSGARVSHGALLVLSTTRNRWAGADVG
jgi:hypothetical protein